MSVLLKLKNSNSNLFNAAINRKRAPQRRGRAGTPKKEPPLPWHEFVEDQHVP